MHCHYDYYQSVRSVTSSILLIVACIISSSSFAIEDAQSSYIQDELDSIKQLIEQNKHVDLSSLFIPLEDYAITSGTHYDVGLVMHSQGNNLYNKKRYHEAILKYVTAIDYLKNEDDKDQKLLANCYHQIAQSYKHLKNVDKAVGFYQKVVDVHAQRDDQPALGVALKNLAMSYNKQGNYLKALDHALKSIEIQKRHSSPTRNAQILLHTGIIYRHIGNFEKSLTYINKAERLYEQEGDILHLAEVDNQIGLIYSKLNQYDNARMYYEKTIALPEEKVKPETRAAAFREQSQIEFETGNLLQAITLINNAISIYETVNYTKQYSQSLLLKGKVQIAQGFNELASQSFEQSFKLATQIENRQLQTQSLLELGKLSLTRSTKQANQLFMRALSLSKQYPSNIEQLAIYQGLKESAKLANNVEEAFKYSEEINRILELVHRKKESSNIAKEKAILESYKLEQDLIELNKKVKLEQLKVIQKSNEIKIIKQENTITELELSKKNSVNILLTALLCVIVFLALFVCRSFIVTRRRNSELKYLANHDPLTGCYNRRAFFGYLQKQFDKPKSEQPCSIILADIDFFKTINDKYGHSVGDEVLREFANILVHSVDEKDCVARIGGEEFCIILPNSNESDAIRKAESLREQIVTNTICNLAVTSSFGVASINESVATLDELFEHADIALYRSKENGRNRVTLWAK